MGWVRHYTAISTPTNIGAKCGTGCVYRFDASFGDATKVRIHFTSFNLESPDIYFDFTTWDRPFPGYSITYPFFYSYTGNAYWYP